MKIAIIGASISGCAVYKSLVQGLSGVPDLSITLYEKSTAKLQDRGVGITLPKVVADSIQNNKLVTNLPKSFLLNSRNGYICRNNIGHKIWTQNFSVQSFNWGLLYSALREDIPEHKIILNKEITAVEEYQDNCDLVFLDGNRKSYDLVIGADGYNSIVRKCLYPQNKLEYANFIAWRGTCSFNNIKSDILKQINNSVSYYLFECGHIIMYPIQNTDIPVMNWVLYQPMRQEQLSLLLTENNSNNTSLNWTDSYELALNNYAKKYLPQEINELIHNSSFKMLQVINYSYPNEIATKRTCLVGDAASVIPPPAGSGAVKGLEDAMELINWNTQKSIENNLSDWQHIRKPAQQSLTNIGKLLVDKFIFNPPNWKDFNQKVFTDWFRQVMDIRSNLKYFEKN